MNRFGKIIGIIIGLIILGVLVINIIPVISTVMNQKPVEQTSKIDVSDGSEGAIAFENFLSNMASAKQFSFCVVKSVKEQDSISVMDFGCTIRGDDYAVKFVENEQEFRQLYLDGKHTYINDTEKTVYKNFRVIDFPDVHFLEALSGKLIHTDSEIVNGNQVNCVQLYKNGIVYAVYFNQLGELTRFYYIYDSNEIALDFCGFYFDETVEYASLEFPSSYMQGVGDPYDMN